MSILTELDTVKVLRYNNIAEIPEYVTAVLIPGIDDFIKTSTGKDWAADRVIDPTAKLVASMLLIRWFDDPGSAGAKLTPGDPLIGLITQLHAKVIDV